MPDKQGRIRDYSKESLFLTKLVTFWWNWNCFITTLNLRSEFNQQKFQNFQRTIDLFWNTLNVQICLLDMFPLDFTLKLDDRELISVYILKYTLMNRMWLHDIVKPKYLQKEQYKMVRCNVLVKIFIVFNSNKKKAYFKL